VTSKSAPDAVFDESTASVVAAIIHRGQDILLVCEQGPNDDSPRWSFPGGRVEENESLHDALCREVLEETGLEVQKRGRLVNLCTLLDSGASYTCAVYEVDSWRGEQAPADPDGLVLEACFLSPADAIDLVEQRPELPRKEPVIAYLRGEVRETESWVYSRLPDASWGFLRRDTLPNG
jgi:8-oxo-dGTP diphosphatase